MKILNPEIKMEWKKISSDLCPILLWLNEKLPCANHHLANNCLAPVPGFALGLELTAGLEPCPGRGLATSPPQWPPKKCCIRKQFLCKKNQCKKSILGGTLLPHSPSKTSNRTSTEKNKPDGGVIAEQKEHCENGE